MKDNLQMLCASFKGRILLLGLILLPFNFYGQTFCSTSSDEPNILDQVDPALLGMATPVHLRIYVHVIRRSDGTGGQTQEEVNHALCILRGDYAPHDIFFYVESIEHIDDDYYFYFNTGKFNDMINTNAHADGIDLYLLDNSIWDQGRASGIPGTALVLGGQIMGSLLVTSHVISHEMGHCLGLFHTHHGLCYTGGGACPELVDGSNCTVCGDYVCDTPPDPQVWQIDPATCAWNGNTCGVPTVDANGDPYNPATDNIMTYTPPTCMELFTVGQGIRMHDHINTTPILQACVVQDTNIPEDFDLYVSDTEHDFGLEPNLDGGPMWISNEIWVRNQQDGFVNQFHQNPEYTGSDPVYVYVRVRNRGCSNFYLDNDTYLQLYWAKAATALEWPTHWNGTLDLDPPNNIPAGYMVGSLEMQDVLASDYTIHEFEWWVEDPDQYIGITPEEWHYCLLARIESPYDQMHVAETANLYENVRNNNNLAWKNVTVVTPDGMTEPGICDNDRSIGGAIAVGNPSDWADAFDLQFLLPEKYRMTHILEEAEIRITLDDLTWDKWEEGGYKGENIAVRREECRQIIITGNPAYIGNMHFDAYERGIVNVGFNFLTDRVTETPDFEYHVIEVRHEGGRVIGGERYDILKPNNRALFTADAGEDKLITKNDSVNLSTNGIGEPAIYNWYDGQGQVIHTGQSVHVSPINSTKYKLEVIALADGFVSYDSLVVTVRDYEITSVTPNPTTDFVTIEYSANEASMSYLSISPMVGNGETTYTIDPQNELLIIDVSGYVPGTYSVKLVCDGVVADVKQLIIL